MRRCVALLLAGLALSCAASQPLALAHARISLMAPAGIETTPGRYAILSGRVSGAPAAAKVALQLRAGDRWRTLVQAPVRGGRFQMSWRPAGTNVSALRFAVIDRGRVLVRAATEVLVSGQAPFVCGSTLMMPTPPGKGVILGEVVQGGERTATSACGTGPPSVVSLEDATGTVIAQETIAGRQGYEFIVSPGSFTVVAGAHGECRASAVVAAIRITHADALCPVS